MNGEEYNLARKLGFLDGYPVANTWTPHSIVATYPIEFVSKDGKIGVSVDEDEYSIIQYGLSRSLDEDVWEKLYGQNEEYDLIMSWKILGYNPVTLGSMSDPFQGEEFNDEL